MQYTKATKIGLVLGSGGARGYAHLGVLKALYEADINIDLVVGTSFGAIVGAAYAAGHNIYDLEKIALETGWIKILKMIDIAPPKGIFAGNKLERFFSVLTQQKHFSELTVPLTLVATDIETGEEVLINKGSVSKAILASSAFPGIFAPVEINNRWLVDGVLINPLPIQTAFDMGADIVIAVDVSSSTDNINYLIALKRYSKYILRNIGQIPYVNSVVFPKGISNRFQRIIPAGFNIVGNALKLAENNQDKMVSIPNNGNVAIIRPRVENIRWRDFHCAQRCIELGAEAVNPSVLNDIKNLSFNYKTLDLCSR
ncbi:phospholipase [Candidatus Atribacteria bacterium HGW-Atribacteria-1]|nr:MAG: phospholipase [Candidatus Atribacteria bacterium HGW-Atribacteria-1]